MSDSEQATCPLCERGNATRRADFQTRIRRYQCGNCGEFVITREDEADFLERPAYREKGELWKVSALTREQTIAKSPPYFLQFTTGKYPSCPNAYPIDVQELLRDHWPDTVTKRLARCLRNLARLSPETGQFVKFERTEFALLFARSDTEACSHAEFLDELGYVTVSINSGGGLVRLSPRGWQEFAAFEKGTSSEDNPVFVAMWYGDEDTEAEMTELYEQGIAPAVKDAGYRVSRADLEQHNEYIMDKVFGMIRAAPFVVADFTGNRNGVYFEAGFARGLGIPVINCCKKSDFDDAHFDTKQLSHIFWGKPAELREPLLYRILGTIPTNRPRHQK